MCKIESENPTDKDGIQQIDMNEIIDNLKALFDSDHDLSIEFDSSPDEAVVIGTKQAYINAAIKLLEIAEQSLVADCEKEVITGVHAVASNHVKYVFNEFGDVWPIAAYVAKDIEHAKKLISIFKSDT